jgi:hypothetical protein
MGILWVNCYGKNILKKSILRIAVSPIIVGAVGYSLQNGRNEESGCGFWICSQKRIKKAVSLFNKRNGLAKLILSQT